MGNKCTCLANSGEHRIGQTEVSATTETEPIGLGIGTNLAALVEPHKTLNSLEASGAVILEGGVKYTGQWNGHVREGHGTLERPDGGRYEGQFADNKAHGNGKLSYASGDVYDGEWVEDTPKGTGGSHTGMGQAMKVNGTKIVSRGMVLNNGLTDRNSKGIICAARNMARVHSIGLIARCTKANSTKTKSMVMANTDGQMAVHSRFHGFGHMIWPDTREYKGGYMEDKKHGEGCFSWPDGRRYNGQWKDGRQHGRGLYLNLNGKVRSGEWLDGKRSRWLEAERDLQTSDGFGISGDVEPDVDQ
eukprot:CAMPEP_0115636488 /NCGR_PEP_ID=MMETSP0272-20121206/33696_1 /TAXON_ID=71861 /ORGANISM="Scrippsiella trochoidea, Strain CCMP3099" /LENGTH=302 /DNA_ID=CAMNT_0003073497 /DNA_START=118 /DNA_END=1027 /DNA_ORIENTATION=-